MPLQLGRRRANPVHDLLFLPLVEVSRRHPGRCELLQWLAKVDTSVWLRQYDLAHLRADGYGIWLQDGHCLRFLAHVDPGPLGEVVAEHERHTGGLGALLAGYRRTDPVVPVAAVLLIADTAEREQHLQHDLVRRPLREPIATTSTDLLHHHWPTEPVWRKPGEDATRRRLIDLARESRGFCHASHNTDRR